MLMTIIQVALFLLVPGVLVYYFIQNTTWTLESFRRGILVVSLLESFPAPIPGIFVGSLVDVDDMSFKFITAYHGLFRTRERMFRRMPSFPLLGEISLNEEGAGVIRIRIPISAIFVCLVFFLGLIAGQVQEASSFSAYLVAILKGLGILAFLSVFGFYAFLSEKHNIVRGLGSIRRHISEHSES
jgi:hypothetical protein